MDIERLKVIAFLSEWCHMIAEALAVLMFQGAHVVGLENM